MEPLWQLAEIIQPPPPSFLLEKHCFLYLGSQCTAFYIWDPSMWLFCVWASRRKSNLPRGWIYIKRRGVLPDSLTSWLMAFPGAGRVHSRQRLLAVLLFNSTAWSNNGWRRFLEMHTGDGRKRSVINLGILSNERGSFWLKWNTLFRGSFWLKEDPFQKNLLTRRGSFWQKRISFIWEWISFSEDPFD